MGRGHLLDDFKGGETMKRRIEKQQIIPSTGFESSADQVYVNKGNEVFFF